MKIVIPSYKRAGKIKALKNISKHIQSKYYWIAVRPEEEKEYKQAYPSCNVKVLTGKVDGVTATRQRINEQFDGLIVVIDDDVSFVKNHLVPYPKGWRGRYQKIAKLRSFTDDDYDEFAEFLEKYSRINPYGALKASQFLQTEQRWPRVWNSGIIWCVWFNLDLFDVNFYNYEKGPEFIEDVFMSLMWFDNGNDAPNLNDWGIVKSAGTGDEDGGCNHHENRSKSHNESADWLVKHYPDYAWLRDSPKYLKTMGAKTNTVETRMRKDRRNIAKGEYSNKPISEFPECKEQIIENKNTVLWYESKSGVKFYSLVEAVASGEEFVEITRRKLGLVK